MMKLNDNDLVFAKVRPNAIIPTKEKENAGYDIYANFEEDYIVIPPHTTKLIPTGIASAMSDKYYLQVHERGSTDTKGMKYGASVIVSGYRDEIFVCLNNVNQIPVIISKLTLDELYEKYYSGNPSKFISLKYKNEYNEFEWIVLDYPYCKAAIIYPYTKAIAQLVVHEVPDMNVREITYEELLQIPSKRGTGALGSSGK